MYQLEDRLTVEPRSSGLPTTYSLLLCIMKYLSSLYGLRRTEFYTRHVSIARIYHSTQQRSSTPRKNCQGERSATSGPPSQSLSPLSVPFWTCRSTWRRAGINTLRCLVGCTSGDFSAMWLLQSYYPELGMSSTMVVSSKFLPPCNP